MHATPAVEALLATLFGEPTTLDATKPADLVLSTVVAEYARQEACLQAAARTLLTALQGVIDGTTQQPSLLTSYAALADHDRAVASMYALRDPLACGVDVVRASRAAAAALVAIESD